MGHLQVEERWREGNMSEVGEAASTTDGLGFVHPFCTIMRFVCISSFLLRPLTA